MVVNGMMVAMAAHSEEQAQDLEWRPELDGHVRAEPGERAEEAHPARPQGLAVLAPRPHQWIVEEVAVDALREDGVRRRVPHRRRQVVDALLLRLLHRVRRHCHHHAVHHHVPGNLSEIRNMCVLVGLMLDRKVPLNLMLRLETRHVHYQVEVN